MHTFVCLNSVSCWYTYVGSDTSANVHHSCGDEYTCRAHDYHDVLTLETPYGA
jgi:hypothetical protein